MEATVSAQLGAIREVCTRHGVRALWLFGSAAAGQFDAASDVDFIVDLGDTDPGPWGAALTSLQRELERVLGRRVDLVTIGAVRSHRRFSAADASKVPVYAAA